MMRMVILTGAGISAESGVPTFRDSGGLWEGHRIEEVATPQGFRKHPELVHQFYNLRRADVQTRQPNDAHSALARLHAFAPSEITIVTQNVDDLHERGGCENVMHMHGELLQIRCLSCYHTARWHQPLTTTIPCSTCGRAGGLRPDVVWFGEMPYFLDEIDAALQECDLFVAIGTSGVVYPAAGFVDIANHRRIPTIEFNRERTAVSSAFTESRIGPATETVTAWVDELLQSVSVGN